LTPKQNQNKTKTMSQISYVKSTQESNKVSVTNKCKDCTNDGITKQYVHDGEHAQNTKEIVSISEIGDSESSVKDLQECDDDEELDSDDLYCDLYYPNDRKEREMRWRRQMYQRKDTDMN